MKESKVGRIKNITYDGDSDELELTIVVTDPSFKKKLLRDFSLSGKLKVKGNKIIFEEEDDASV
jgi:hypothetical protein